MKTLIRLALFIGTMVMAIEGQDRTFSGFNNLYHQTALAKYISTRKGQVRFIGTNDVLHYFDKGVQKPEYNGGAPIKSLAYSLTYDSAWMVGIGHHVWRWNRSWQSAATDVDLFLHVSGISLDKALAVKNDNSIFIHENGKWTKLEGQAKKVALGTDDDRWIIGMDSRPYRWEGNSWVSKPLHDGVAAVHIDVLNKDNIVVNDDRHHVYIWQNNQWVLVDEARGCIFATIDAHTSGNCGHLYCIDPNHKIWHGTFACNQATPAPAPAPSTTTLKPGECTTCSGTKVCAQDPNILEPGECMMCSGTKICARDACS